MIKGRGASAPRFLFSVELIGDTGKIGAGEENLSRERFSSPAPNPTPSTPKIFDWWGGCVQGVPLYGGERKP